MIPGIGIQGVRNSLLTFFERLQGNMNHAALFLDREAAQGRKRPTRSASAVRQSKSRHMSWTIEMAVDNLPFRQPRELVGTKALIGTNVIPVPNQYENVLVDHNFTRRFRDEFRGRNNRNPSNIIGTRHRTFSIRLELTQ